MLKRLAIMGALTGVAALAVGSVVPATGQGSADRHRDDDTIKVVSVNTEEAFVDVGEPDLSLGDSFVFTSNLTRHGDKVGHTGVECTITSVAREETQCLGSAVFHHGQITIQGLLAGEPEKFSFAITGGTGAYEGAEGTLFVRVIDDEKELLIFDLDD
jgi:hypothetical protein